MANVAGDMVLQAVAKCLAGCIRPMDTVARYGGEEFAVVLPNCLVNVGQAVAERIRQTVESLTIKVSPLVSVKATISIGGAYAPEWVRSTAALWIERADSMLYRAKSRGAQPGLYRPPAGHCSECRGEESFVWSFVHR